LISSSLAYKSSVISAFNKKFNYMSGKRINQIENNFELNINKRFSPTVLQVGDYAAEIEKAVGVEIYGPIFQAGLFLFLSGFVSAAVVSIIISKSDSWTEIGKEFDRGKQSQLIDVEKSVEIQEAISQNRDEQNSVNLDGLDF
jgi:hypothetical protein